MVRLSTNSSHSDIFTKNKHEYEVALKNTGYKAKLVYKFSDEVADVHNGNNRRRKILLFTPPYKRAVTNKIEKEFLGLLKKNFPQSNSLYKIFNRNMIKLNYCTMLNVVSLINKSNI